MRRPLLLALAVGVVACASRAPTFVLLRNGTPSAQSVDTLIDAHPLGASENIRPVALGSTEALSYHLVQIRDRESPHIHAAHDLVVTLLRGHGELHLGDGVLPMTAGDSAVVPRGTRHWFTNLGTTPAVAFVTFAPPYDGTDSVPVE